MENEKVYQWKSKWLLIFTGGLFATTTLALTIPDLMSHGLIALGPLVLLLAVGVFTLSQLWKKLRSNRLILSDAGLRRVSVYGEYFVPWKEMRLLKIRKNRKGEVRGIM